VMLYAYAGSAGAQSFIDDIDRISRASELAKHCEALAKLGGTDERCTSAMTPLQRASSQGSSEIKKDISLPARSVKVDDLDVISYSSTASSSSVDVVVDGRLHRMRVGDAVAGWKLAGLTEYKATFQSLDKSKRRLEVAFRMPPATPSAVASPALLGVPGSPGAGPVPMPSPLPAGLIPPSPTR
jgi:hypothetical protein